MLVDVDHEKKLVCYYLSRQERDDKVFRESLKPEYQLWKERGYLTCVFLSGDGDLKEAIEGLIRHNLAKKYTETINWDELKERSVDNAKLR